MTQKIVGQLFLFSAAPMHADRGQRSDHGVSLLARGDDDVPLLPASTVHGAVRSEFHRAMKRSDASVEVQGAAPLFGIGAEKPRDQQAAIRFSDGVLVAIPVRTIRGHFVWIANRGALERIASNVTSAQGSAPYDLVALTGDGLACGIECVLTEGAGGDPHAQERVLQLEEFTLPVRSNTTVDTIAAWLATFALPQTSGMEWWREKLKHSFVVADPTLFAKLAHVAMPMQARATVTGARLQGLTAREFLPSDSILCADIYVGDQGESSEVVREAVRRAPLSIIQLGSERGVGAGVAYCRTLL